MDFTYLGEKENCCGTPMMVTGKWDVFAAVMKDNIRAVKETGADTVITSCPACDMMWRHVYPERAKKMGLDYGITAKHSPKGFAQLMQTMWPELIDAMPFKIGPLMRLMGKVPGSLELMKPLFPILFPRLLPLMRSMNETTRLHEINTGFE